MYWLNMGLQGKEEIDIEGQQQQAAVTARCELFMLGIIKGPYTFLWECVQKVKIIMGEWRPSTC